MTNYIKCLVEAFKLNTFTIALNDVSPIANKCKLSVVDVSTKFPDIKITA